MLMIQEGTYKDPFLRRRSWGGVDKVAFSRREAGWQIVGGIGRSRGVGLLHKYIESRQTIDSARSSPTH